MHGLDRIAPEGNTERPRVVLYGREEVLIEKHAGLFSYETKCIRIRTKMGLLAVTGEELVISFFGMQDLLIRGKISGVMLDDKQ